MRATKKNVVSGSQNLSIGTSIRLGKTTLNLSIHNSITPIIEIVGIFPLFLISHIVIEAKITIIFRIVSAITVPPTINMVL